MGAALAAFILIFLLAKDRKARWKQFWSTPFFAAKPGLFLFLTIALQAWGLYWTTATKSAFLTVLYVIIVPLLNGLTGREKLRWAHGACVLLALLGISIFQKLEWSRWNFGDTLMVGAAIAAAFHILSVGRRAPRSSSSFIFNLWQNFWVATLALFFYPFTDRWKLMDMPLESWAGLLVLTFGSSLLAFYLQIRAQTKIPSNLASMLFLLESPFSALFAFLLLNEKLEYHHMIGGLAILAACAWAILSENPRQSTRA